MKVNEIFYSLQGEGVRAGVPSIFIRLSGCKAKMACLASGVKCDTEFEAGREMSVEEILAECGKYPSKCIIWTGGEPTDQLTADVVGVFYDHGYYQAIETSGLNPVPQGIDWITLSPKVGEHVLAKNFPRGVDEIKYVRNVGQAIPQPGIHADHYLISPHADGARLPWDVVEYCINLIKENPQWRLSLQLHKILNVR